MNEADYWPEGKRYGVMTVQGYSPSAGESETPKRLKASHAFVFSVIDQADAAREVRRFKAMGLTLDVPRVQKVRNDAIAYADRMNALDAPQHGAL